jgi:hypothetical protein
MITWFWFPPIYWPPDNRKGYREIAEAIRFAATPPAERAAQAAKEAATKAAEVEKINKQLPALAFFIVALVIFLLILGQSASP